ncbi:conserved hypothetical protein [Thiobacillus denitrificans ATCC 25259]|uniref:Outer membrane or secreted lipoprotein n=1 Tax=Thiobacillus denitrificans (strain ATCC 25259 / T1) TaxID=292415 RepID=Q3SGN4_THIDA|nr:OBAP family protein [Thiobacillus denitrificans]AAZ98213.1 conserved hypothetical protein [Thiobacillus denitrificans ATCC 25259]
MPRSALLLSLIVTVATPALAADAVETPTHPPGAEASSKTQVLKAGSAVLQSESPLKPMHVHLSGFHAMKNDPAHQMAAEHYCSQVNEDFAQCALFDGNTRSANLTGIEYIISEKLFKQLPAQERQYWHPHNYEILSGQLVAPGLPDVAEKALMKGKMNSYGKTWHVWNTGDATKKGDPLPYGDPALAWSFNRDGEADAGMVQRRDRALEIDPVKKRRGRADLTPLARPQQGVDALHGKFAGPGQPVPGVLEAAGSTGPAPRPTVPR